MCPSLLSLEEAEGKLCGEYREVQCNRFDNQAQTQTHYTEGRP